MAILPISSVRPDATVELNYSALRQRSAEVPETLDRSILKRIAFDLLETLYSTPSGVGLAAPQIGLLLRIVITDLGNPARAVDPHVLVNPVVVARSAETQDGFESCLSIPLFRGRVQRAEEIRVSALNHRLEPIEFEARGFEARLIEHEVDHLEGVLYPDRMEADEVLEELPVPAQLAADAEEVLYEHPRAG